MEHENALSNVNALLSEAAEPEACGTGNGEAITAKAKHEPDERHRVRYRRLSSAQLDAASYELEYLIDRTLVAGQPCIVAGGKKCLKTSLLLDMGINLATSGFFLGKLRVNRAARVGIMTGESGLATIQETARRICRAAGKRLADVGGLVFSEDLPRFGSLEHEAALRRFIEHDELEVVVIDPAYLCLPGGDAGNLFVQGDLLRGMAKVCTDTGCMMVLAHHTRKTKTDPYEPPELEDIAWAGFQEFARQWLLVGRRGRYEPGTGRHQLWLSVGGSAGHSALWALDVNEGTRDTEGGRFWDVDIKAAEEARQEAHRQRQRLREEERRDRRAAQLEEDKAAVRRVLAIYPEGETKTKIRDMAGLSGERLSPVLAAMLSTGDIVPADVPKGSHKRPYEGYKLSCEDDSK